MNGLLIALVLSTASAHAVDHFTVADHKIAVYTPRAKGYPMHPSRCRAGSTSRDIGNARCPRASLISAGK
jgi:hypothetical protein